VALAIGAPLHVAGTAKDTIDAAQIDLERALGVLEAAAKDAVGRSRA